MTEPIHVLLADDHDVVREGLKSSLRAHEEFSVVGEARDGAEAVQLASRLKPDLVVMDVRMPRLSGIEACRDIRDQLPDTNVLILTSYGDERAVMSSIMAGAGGFMLKDVRVGALLDAMRVVGRGGTTLDPMSTATVISKIREGNILSEEDRLAQQLNERELAVLELIADGLTNRQIGERLFLSEKTVKHHVSDILAKLGLTRRVEAATFAIRRNAQRPPESL
jgi:DNA-binding NarL/FixJ family response regulator